jgi:hypothetical protein
MSTLISREEARRSGLKHYRNGIPCMRGHVAPRFTSTTGCTQCIREGNRRRRLELGKKRPMHVSDIK